MRIRRPIPSRRQRFPLSRVNAQKEAEAASEARFAEQVSCPALGLDDSEFDDPSPDCDDDPAFNDRKDNEL